MSLARVSLAAVLVLATVERAEAVMPPETYAEPETVVLPAGGSADVPLNARLWKVRINELVRDAPATSTELGDLRPNSHYIESEVGFTTGVLADTTPPSMPRIQIDLATEVSLGEDVPRRVFVHTSTRMAPDVAFLQIDIADPNGTVSFATTRHRTMLSQAGIELTPGDVRVTARAFDVAGNVSEPFVTTVHVGLAIRKPVPEQTSCEREGTSPIVLGMFLLLMSGIPIAAVVIYRRRKRTRCTEVEPVSLLFAEDALRILLRGHRVGAVVTGVMTAGLLAAIRSVPGGGEQIAGSIVFMLPAIAFVVFVGQLLFDHAALRYLSRDGATAERRGSYLIVGGATGNLEIRLSASIFEAARDASVPAASAGLRRGD